MNNPVTYTNQGLRGAEYSAVVFRHIDDAEEPTALVEVAVGGGLYKSQPAVEAVADDDVLDVVLDREQVMHLYRWLGRVIGRSSDIYSPKIIE